MAAACTNSIQALNRNSPVVDSCPKNSFTQSTGFYFEGVSGATFMRITMQSEPNAIVRRAVTACCALALGAAVASPAHATDYLFDFANTNSSGQTFSLSGSGNGNIASFTKAGLDGSTLSMRMSAWSINSNSTIRNAILNFYSGSGVGIDNRYEPNTSPDHSIDNDSDGVDFLVLQFDQKVDLNGIDIGWVYNDSDATIRWNPVTVTPWNVLPNFDGQPDSILNSLGSTTLLGGSSAGPMRDITTTGNAMANFWIISAADPNPRKTDYFKLQAVVVNNYPPVPEPATWLMMITGFGGIGWSMRRRRAPYSGKSAFPLPRLNLQRAD